MGVAKTPTKKGTTVTNKYQKNMPKTSTGPGLAVPDEVTIAMGEIAEDMREGSQVAQQQTLRNYSQSEVVPGLVEFEWRSPA